MLNLHQISRTNLTLLPTLLSTIEDNRVFKKFEHRQSFIKNITNLLNLRDSRSCALSTLNIFCDHHTVEEGVVTEKTSPEIGWIEQCLKIIDQESQHHKTCFEILAKLLRITATNPDTNKIVQSKYVQKIIEAIVAGSSSPIEALNCLAICMTLHAGTSGIYKNKIYDYCISFIDNSDDELIEHVAMCLHILQQTRGGSVGGGVYKKCWAELHEKTINSLVDVLEQIKKKSGKEGVGKSEKLQLPELKLSHEPVNLYTQLLIRFKNLSTVLRVALEKPFPVAKSILIHRMISLIEDGISMNQLSVGKKSLSDNAILMLLNSEIQRSLLSILRSLMNCLKANLLTLSKSIADILWRCLKQTSMNEQSKFDSNLKLRSDVYDTLITFMKLSPNNFHVKNIMENIMKEALVDITPAVDESFLIISTQENGEKKKKKGNVNGKLLKGKAALVNLVDVQKTCEKALECLGCLLMYQGVLMKPVLFYVLQEKVLAIGFRISSSVQKEDELYHDFECRMKLCDLFLLMMLHPVQKNPIPLNFCLALLTQLKHTDPDENVRDKASQNLLRAESVIHNKKEVFYFPSDYRELRDTLLFNKSTIQKLSEIPSENHSNGKSMKAEIYSESEEDEEDEDVDENGNDENNETMDEENEMDCTQESHESAMEEDEEEVEESLSDEELENDEKEEETIKPPTQEIKITPSPQQKRTRQTTAAANIIEKPLKKPKTSDLKDEQVVEEMLADFADD